MGCGWGVGGREWVGCVIVCVEGVCGSKWRVYVGEWVGMGGTCDITCTSPIIHPAAHAYHMYITHTYVLYI